jgi:hypothetical protein
VEKFLGTNGYGEDTFAAPVTVVCFADDTRRLVRGTKTGTNTSDQIVSESTLYTYPVSSPLFVADSRVTLNGTVSRVIKTNVNVSGALDLPDHVAVNLT